MKTLRSIVTIACATTILLVGAPATAAIKLVDASCSLATGCEFDGNIAPNTVLETQIAYNDAKSPDIVLNYLGKSDSGFGAVTGGSIGSGEWTASGFVIDYIAVKSGNQFMLYSAAGDNGFYTTDGLQNGKNKGLPALSHIAFFGRAGAVPEPATWAMMLVGFGAVGGAMRSKSRKRAPSFV
ncbi:hypothetical protein FHS49_000936 [Sphingobium boeckii]|uniref:Ice-binding protein C-terminal domain-containing protein n=1 Tax=Sphingobium boeckii TaxID=1082345 RepID=A0A7W9AG16_9SPHN|nr:PEPxxWA-CTERM sorting domain-containing protein [Sphingobium boeckii]MBB5684945.1 hypothetical protein [Sphingobium boeckii]